MKRVEHERRFRLARVWSNRELEKVARLFHGKIINVSAGEDVDKEDRCYADYFCNKTEYYISNYCPGSFRGYQGRPNEILLDLTKELPEEYRDSFDVVFNHTTLEHVFEIEQAFRNICQLSRDVVIVVVPFAQVQHEAEAFGDFWRFTPTCMRRLFESNGLHVVYESANNDVNAAVYLFVVASRFPERWRALMPPFVDIYPAGEWIGRTEPDKDRVVARHDWKNLFWKAGRRIRRKLLLNG